ncbi:hypothetical protein ColTof4_14347 [Colletotrichum tofieldiae]|nr:hypothetical protein ColTof3_14758 [Colletotrichum tofieldiae]GKT81924.1 hypothetical protein ColTof4_14347 [Colletotrichum tofieldiae]
MNPFRGARGHDKHGRENDGACHIMSESSLGNLRKLTSGVPPEELRFSPTTTSALECMQTMEDGDWDRFPRAIQERIIEVQRHFPQLAVASSASAAPSILSDISCMSNWPSDPGWLPQEALRERQARTWGAATPPLGLAQRDPRSPTALDIRWTGSPRGPLQGVPRPIESTRNPYAGAGVGLAVGASTSRGVNGGGVGLSSSGSGAVDSDPGFVTAAAEPYADLGWCKIQWTAAAAGVADADSDL